MKMTLHIVLFFLLAFPYAGNSQPDFDDLRNKIRQFTHADSSSIEHIYSFARCSGPRGTYSTEVISTYKYLQFKQLFSYRPDTTLYILENEKSCNISGRSLNSFEQFVAKSHDFIRSALQPEFMIQSAEHISTETDTILISGTTFDDHGIAYFLDAVSFKPLGYSLQILGMKEPVAPIRVEFKAWISTGQIRYPERVTIRQGEEVFRFKFESVRFNTAGKEKRTCHEI